MVVRHDLMIICDIFMSCVCLILPLLPRFTPMYLSAMCVYIMLYTSHIFGCRMLDLVDISMPNLFALIVSCLYKPSHLKTSTPFILEVIVINHKKGGD